MHFYKGAFSHSQILEMPWSQFLMYQEYMFYLERWKTEEGAKENKMLNRQDAIIYNKRDSVRNTMQLFKQKIFDGSLGKK
jgi:hypothetical protein